MKRRSQIPHLCRGFALAGADELAVPRPMEPVVHEWESYRSFQWCQGWGKVSEVDNVKKEVKATSKTTEVGEKL